MYSVMFKYTRITHVVHLIDNLPLINGLAVNKFIVSYASFVLLLLKEFNEEIVLSIGFIHKRICDAGSLRHVYDLILVILVTLSERNIPLTSDKSFHCQGLQFLQ